MKNTNYSKTWTDNSHLLRKSLEWATPANFYLGSSFAGLYERPSPFPYRKNSVLGSSDPETLDPKLALRKWFQLKWDEWNLRVGLQFGRLEELEQLLPTKASAEPHTPPFFWSFSQRKLNGPYLKAAEQMKILLQNDNFTRADSICEIGAGFGALAETAIYQLSPKKYFIVDLPEMLDISYGFLSAQIAGASWEQPFIREAWRRESLFLGATEIFFIDATEPEICLPVNVGLFLNSSSFAEMEKAVLDRYLTLIEGNPGTKLLSANPRRMEGSFLFDPDGFVAARDGWRLLARQELRSHASYRGIVVTMHSVGAA